MQKFCWYSIVGLLLFFAHLILIGITELAFGGWIAEKAWWAFSLPNYLFVRFVPPILLWYGLSEIWYVGVRVFMFVTINWALCTLAVYVGLAIEDTLRPDN